MKKTMYFFAALCVFTLCACGKADRSALPNPEELKTLEGRELSALDADGTQRMMNLMCENRALIRAGTLYCFDFDADWQPVLAAYTLADGTLSDYRTLVSGCLPECLAWKDGRLYYINAAAGGAIESVAPDGSDRQTLTASSCSFLQLSGDGLYYCRADGRFCRAAADGGGETVLIDDECCYPYYLGDAVLYQSGSGGERLRLRWTADGAEIDLSSGAAYAPVIIGDRLYYTGADGLHSLGLDGLDGESAAVAGIRGAAEFILTDDGFTARGAAEQNGLRQWSAAADGGGLEYAGARGYRLCCYLGGGQRVDTDYYSNGRIRCFILTHADGSETEYIAGRITG